jgi:hypothetical protein
MTDTAFLAWNAGIVARFDAFLKAVLARVIVMALKL